MEYRRCGNSGVLLPKISLGMWHNFGRLTPYETSRAIALTAFECGITHFDLANNYGPEPGAAEYFMGSMMRSDFCAHRDELFISTKAAYDMWEGPYGSWASRKHLIASLNQSLKRMNLEYVDLFYCHRYDPETPLEETLQTLVDVVRQGKALYIGLSRWPLEAARFGFHYLRQRDVPCLIYQGRLNMLDKVPLHEGILKQCQDDGVGFISFSPLAQGLLTDRYLKGIPEDSRIAHDPRFLKADALTPERMSQIRALNDIAAERGESLATMALSWILQQAGVTSVIVGASSPEQLRKNLQAVDAAPFTTEELQQINKLTQ
ncbi:MAG: aldo/keto reductase [Bacteroidaceae bacterium]|nr:aldo/keto reductase [Bacteroidaceae bacterium]